MFDLIYAGIGSRKTPRAIFVAMRKMAAWLARSGWHLSTGGAYGADTAFASGAPVDQRTIWLPWPEYNELAGPDCHIPSDMAASTEIAAKLHPNWRACGPAARKFHGRNVNILLGDSLDNPVDAVIAWTEGGEVKGGTGMGLRIASEYGIPIFNLGSIRPRDACKRMLAIKRTLQS